MEQATKQKTRVLFSWVAHRDILCMIKSLQEDNWNAYKVLSTYFNEKLILNHSEGFYKSESEKTTSPICSVFKSHIPRFDKIYFLWNYGCTEEDNALWDRFRTFIFKEHRYEVEEIEKIDVKIDANEAHNLELVYNCVCKTLSVAKTKYPQIEPYFLVGNGTRQMENVWFLVGNIFFGKKANFIDVTRRECDISQFTLQADFARAIEKNLLEKYLPNDAPELEDFKRITKNSCCEAINSAVNRAYRAALTNHNILLFGETGTGKELFANAIHMRSGRKGKFYSINCAMSTPQLLESRLFGTVKGAFTGAENTEGLLKICDNGTLFLDELEACTPELQAKLLRIMQPPDGESADTRCFSCVGSSKIETTHVRIICATNESLRKEGFRNDLLNRAAELTIQLPPLRERGEDTVLLANAFLRKNQQELTVKGTWNCKKFSPDAINLIQSYSWPGNIRELKNIVLQAMLFGNSDQKEITAADIRSCLGNDIAPAEEEPIDLSQPIDLKALAEKASNQVKVHYILEAYHRCGKHKKKMADILGIKYQTLDNWIADLEKVEMLPEELLCFKNGTVYANK